MALHGKTKVTVYLPASTWNTVEGRANHEGISRGEVLRRAVWLYGYVRAHQEAGGELLLRSQDGGREERIILEVAEPAG